VSDEEDDVDPLDELDEPDDDVFDDEVDDEESFDLLELELDFVDEPPSPELPLRA
jgi:hypothetical protein